MPFDNVSLWALFCSSASIATHHVNRYKKEEREGGRTKGRAHKTGKMARGGNCLGRRPQGPIPDESCNVSMLFADISFGLLASVVLI